MIYLVQTEITLKIYYSVPVIKEPNILPGCIVYFEKDGISEVIKCWELKEIKKLRKENQSRNQLYRLVGFFDCDLENKKLISNRLFDSLISTTSNDERYNIEDLIKPKSLLGEKVEIKESIWTKIKNWFKHDI